MHQNTFNHPVLLCLLCQIYEPSIRIIIIRLHDIFQPIRLSSNVLCTALFIEQLNTTSPDSHIDNTHFDIRRQIINHSTSKIITWGQSRMATRQRRKSLIPLSFYPSALRTINSRHHQKTFTYTYTILRFHTCIAFHIRLPESQINMKILILRMHS